MPHEHPYIVARLSNGECAGLGLPNGMLAKAVPPVKGYAALGDPACIVESAVLSRHKDCLSRDKGGTQIVINILAVAFPVETVCVLAWGCDTDRSGGKHCRG